MPNEIHSKLSVSEAALDFGTSGAELNSLPAGDVAWCAPITTLGDEEWAEFTLAINAGTSTPSGTIEYYIIRDTGTLVTGDHHIDPTDHGNEGTAADIASLLADLGGPVFAVEVSEQITYKHAFKVWEPGESLNLLVYNKTNEAFASSGHSAYVRGKLKEIQ